MSFPLAPWHLWGNSQVLQLRSLSLGNPEQSNQLARVAYARPESWNFLFAFRIIEVEKPTNFFTLDISFDLTIGVGRTVVQIPSYETFRWENPGAVAIPLPQLFYSTQVITPNRSRVNGAPVTGSNPGVSDYFVAEDIQCQVRTVFTDSGGPGSANTMSAEAFAFFAPRVHIRPEWFSDEVEQFRGKETGGT